MMNNPMLQMIGLLRNSKNPMAMLENMAQSNPQVRQFMQVIGGKSEQELREIARNMAKERGTSVEDVARQLGITIPSDR